MESSKSRDGTFLFCRINLHPAVGIFLPRPYTEHYTVGHFVFPLKNVPVKIFALTL